MPIIELAHINLLPHGTTPSPKLLQTLHTVTTQIESASHLRTLFYAEREDPSVFYVLGAWASQAAHQTGFNGSPGQDRVLELVKGTMDIDWMYYLDVELEQIAIEAPVLEIKRYFLKGGVEREKFREALAAAGTKGRGVVGNETEMEGGGGGGGSVGAWNLPKREGEEVLWVQFTGLRSVDEQGGSAAADQAVEDMVEKIDVRHATRVWLP